jgi:glutathione S-transferase
MEQQQKPQLFYWNIRGLGSFICMAFAAANKDYELKEFTGETANEWFGKDKMNLPMTLPNLPYLKDGLLYISEHDAIFKHVLRKYKPDLLGDSIDEQAEIDQFVSFLVKLNLKIREYCYKDTTKDASTEDKSKFLEQFKFVLERIDARIANNGKKFLLGNKFTAADIFLFETFWMMKVIDPNLEKTYTNINEVSKNIEEMDWFKNYKNSEKWRNQLNYHSAHINN